MSSALSCSAQHIEHFSVINRKTQQIFECFSTKKKKKTECVRACTFRRRNMSRRSGGGDGYGGGTWKLVGGRLRELERVKVKAKDG